MNIISNINDTIYISSKYKKSSPLHLLVLVWFWLLKTLTSSIHTHHASLALSTPSALIILRYILIVWIRWDWLDMVFLVKCCSLLFWRLEPAHNNIHMKCEDIISHMSYILRYTTQYILISGYNIIVCYNPFNNRPIWFDGGWNTAEPALCHCHHCHVLIASMNRRDDIIKEKPLSLFILAYEFCFKTKHVLKNVLWAKTLMEDNPWMMKIK